MSDDTDKFDTEARSYSSFAGGGTSSSEIVIVSPISRKDSTRDLYSAVFKSLDDPKFPALFAAAASGKLDDADNFFNSFRYVQDLRDGNYSLALPRGISLLRKCKATDPATYEKIHKGAAFYWVGMAAFLVSDYETATFFFDSAVSEDIRAKKDPGKDPTPSFRFLLLEGDQPDHAAQALVMATENLILKAMHEYNALAGRSPGLSDLEMGHIRDHFLLPAISTGKEHWRTLATAFISFFLEAEYRGQLIELRPAGGTAEPFYLHLFKGCLLLESLLKANPKHPTTQTTLEKVLDDLSAELGISQLKLGRASFPAIIADLSTGDGAIETAMRFSGRIRNTVGHNLGWKADLDKTQYDQLVAMVSSACLHSIACLYR